MAVSGKTNDGGSDIAAMIKAQPPEFSLNQAFYTDAGVFERDMERIIMTDWLYAGHVSEIPQTGDYFLFTLMGEQVIIVRGHDGQVRALANVCRHRGSRVCSKQKGRVARFVCPYHAWSYDLDGSLLRARLMDRDLESKRWGLKPVAVGVLEGMIFVNFAENPCDFATAEQKLKPYLAPFALADTKIARRETYAVKANWKLLVENYHECYHCAVAHPEYCRSHTLQLSQRQIDLLFAEMAPRTEACGLSAEMFDQTGPSRMPGCPPFYYDRHALQDGYVTGSEDGKPVAPLLGQLTDFDQGASNVTFGLTTFMLIYSDHAVIYRFVPAGVETSEAEIVWLVRADAEEGKDYDPAKVSWLWDVTTVADKRIVEKNHEGVRSRYYEPGPYAPMEKFTRDFVAEYLNAIG